MMPYDQQTERPVSNAFNAGLTRLLATALADKSLIWAALIGDIAIWGYALYQPDMMRLIAAGGYSALVFIPVLFKKG